MIIIDKSKKTPRFIYDKWAKDKPSLSASKLEKDRFWDREMERWHNGHGGLTNYHYFFLTQSKIKNAEGAEIRPFWRDIDDLKYGAYAQAIKQNEDLLVVKRRESGLTTDFAGIIPIVNSLIFPGSINLITSADKERIKDLFLNKTSVVYDNLDSEIKPVRAGTRQEGFMFFAKKDGRTGEYSGLKSMIVCKETVDKPNAFETYRAKSVFIDEFFLHPRASEVRTSAQACVKKGFLKIAPIVLGGSCGVTSVEGAKAGRQLWQDSQQLGIINLFIPGWMGISYAPELDDNGRPTGKVIDFCQNGYSDEKEATEWILKTRNKLSKAHDKKPYQTFVKEYPLSIEEVFQLNNEGALPQDIVDKLNQQERIIIASPPPRQTYLLEEVDGQIKATPSPKGWLHIIEHPQPRSEYLSATDPIPFGDANLDDGSENAFLIKDRHKETYVAYYKERNLDPNVVKQRMLIAQNYYNRCKNFLETNQGKVIYHKYKDDGDFDMLADRVGLLGIKYTDKTVKKGWYKNDKTSPRANSLLLEYLRNHAHNIWFIEIIDELKRFLKDNTDLVDAMMGCELCDADMVKRESRRFKKHEFKEIPQVQYVNGKTEVVWKKVRIG